MLFSKHSIFHRLGCGLPGNPDMPGKQPTKRMFKGALLVASCLASVPASATPVLVVDVASRDVLYQEDAGVPWYPASTTKMMTALLTFEALHANVVSLKTPVVMSRNATKQAFLESGLTFGRTMTIEDALYATITASANDVAVALAETVASSEPKFVARMNERAAQLGMTGTHFASPNGLFSRQNYSTARDLAILGMEIDRLFPEYRHFFQATAVTIDGKEIKSNNLLLSRYPGTIGMKTGFLCASGRNYVGLATRNGKQVMVVVLGATTERERNERSAQYLTQAFDGQLAARAERVDDIPNRPEVAPEDMRIRLCTNQSAAYETSREALYPMGLPGHETYLQGEGPSQVYAIRTWASETVESVPLPAPRPVTQ